MTCPSCDVNRPAVTLSTPIGVKTVCAQCALKGGNTGYLSALNEVTWLEHMWKRDSSQVKGDGPCPYQII